MMRIGFLLIVLVITSCATREASNNVAYETPDPMMDQGEYATYFVLIADTNASYYPLQKEMYRLSQLNTWEIDTMGRTYYPEKDLVALPEDDEDEIYAGDYFPRRFPSESLSIEYLVLYKDQANEKTLALVRGIYEEQAQAQTALKLLKKYHPKAFVQKAEMYIGCMH